MAQRGQDAQWAQRLQQWKLSGKSGAAWAKEQGIPDHVFGYWRRKLLGSGAIPSRSKPFIELTDALQTSSGITLEKRGLVLHLSSDFDSVVLKRLLGVLQEC